MAYAIELAEIRTYTHTFLIDTDDELEAQRIAEELANSSDFLDYIAGNGSYFDTNLEVGEVWETDNQHIEPLTNAEIAKYTEG